MFDILAITEDISNLILKGIDNLTIFALGVVLAFMIIDLVFSFSAPNVDFFILMPIKLLKYSVYFAAIKNYKWFTGIIYRGAIEISYKAAGLPIRQDLNVKPTFILVKFIEAFSKELAGTGVVALILDFVGIDTPTTVTIAIILGVILICIFITVNILMTIIEFQIITLGALIFLPFGVIEQTANIGKNALLAIFNQSIKLFMQLLFYNFTVVNLSSWMGTTTEWSIFNIINAVVFLILINSLMTRTSNILSAILGGGAISGGGTLGPLQAMGGGSWIAKKAFGNSKDTKNKFKNASN